MSQYHYFIKHNNEITHVQMGWDRPLQGFFLVIEKESDLDEPFWSNLNQKVSHPKILDPFIKVLKELKIEVPSQMLDELLLDKVNNMGNKVIVYGMTINGGYTRNKVTDISSYNLLELYQTYTNVG